MKSDVFLLQECTLPFLKSYRDWEQQWTAGPSLWSGSHYSQSNGVAILIKTPNILVKGSTVMRDGRALSAKLTFLGIDFNILNVYGFNDKNDGYDLLEELQPHMLGREPLVVGGDFNCILNKKDRNRDGKSFQMDKTCFIEVPDRGF